MGVISQFFSWATSGGTNRTALVDDDGHPLVVRAKATKPDNSAVVTVGLTSSLILAASDDRRECIIQNIGDENVYLGKTDNNISPQTKYDKPESAVIESKPLLSKGDKLNKAMEFLRTAKDNQDAMQKLETIKLKYTLTPEIEKNLLTLIEKL